MERERVILFSLAALSVIVVVVLRVPSHILLWLALACVGLGLFALYNGAAFVRGWRAIRAGDDEAALGHFQRFECDAMCSVRVQSAAWLFGVPHTINGVALARYHIGRIHLRRGQLEEAAKWFDRALDRDSEYALAHLYLAVVAARQGHGARASASQSMAEEYGCVSEPLNEHIRAVLAHHRDAGTLLQA
jgi:TPR repeat protein